MTRARVIRVALILAVATAAVAVPMLSSQARDVGVRSDGVATNLEAGARAAFTPAQPQLLAHATAAYRWAIVLHTVTALRSPGSTPVAALSTRSPEGTPNAVLVLGSVRRQAVEWVHVRLPVLPNNTTGWVRRSALGGYQFVTTHLVIDLRRLRATLFRDGRPIFTAPVGIGQPQWPTPRGQFYIRDELSDYASPFYGPVAFGTSARSSVLTEWPDGGFVGIHGTDAPQLIPGRVSHGCIRLRNRDILRLARLMPVGTPLTIS
jgi:lipoprotein-anchoring transpeptidase ErfK/SrfK